MVENGIEEKNQPIDLRRSEILFSAINFDGDEILAFDCQTIVRKSIRCDLSLLTRRFVPVSTAINSIGI